MATARKIYFSNAIMNLIAAPIRFALNLYLASTLLPSDYGIMVIPAIIISFSNILIDSGLKTSLIQKATLKNSHSSSIFYVNIGVSLVLFIFFVSVSKSLEYYFNIESLALLICLAALSLLIKSFALVNEARFQIKGKYGKLIFIELISYVVAYLVAIYMAKDNYGPLSLAAMGIVSSLLYAFLLFITDDFKPKWKLVSKKLVFFHWRIGKPLLMQGVLETISDKVDEVVLSKFIGISKLGEYSKGREYSNTLGIIGSKFFARPWFSIMSKYSSNKILFSAKYMLAYLLLVLGGTFLIFGNYFFGKSLILFTLGDKWTSLIELFNYFVISIALYYLVTFNKYTILALGNAEVNLKLESYYAAFRFSSLVLVFIFFNNDHLIIFLLLLDILSKTLLIILQALSLSNLLLEVKIKKSLIMYTSLILLLSSIPFFVNLGVKSFTISFIVIIFAIGIKVAKLYKDLQLLKK
jgi:O-antigen/teichoic acid export membrane protein